MTKIIINSLDQKQREKVLPVLEAALRAADPRVAVRQSLSFEDERLYVGGGPIDLSRYRRIRVIGEGKAAQAMTRGLVDVLGSRITDGILITKHVEREQPFARSIQVLPGGHPVPSAQSLSAGQALAGFLQSSQETDLIICLISGGGSALVTYPQDGILLQDLQALTGALLASGADINEINTLRKHLDRVKGGGLARMASPGRVVALILSDVIGSPLDVIASGPTVADPTTYQDALGILEKYAIIEKIPSSIRSFLESGKVGTVPETLKPGDPVFLNVLNLIIASNAQAAQAALESAREAGFQTLLLTTYLQGEASQAGMVLAGILKQMDATGQPLPRPSCIIAGGETTVTLRGSGLGGRNQELALAAVSLLSGVPDVALAALGTDGEDGPTDAAGALVTGSTLARAQTVGMDPLDYLRRNDSYHFFTALNDLIRTGPTGTNVNDLTFLFAF